MIDFIDIENLGICRGDKREASNNYERVCCRISSEEYRQFSTRICILDKTQPKPSALHTKVWISELVTVSSTIYFHSLYALAAMYCASD